MSEVLGDAEPSDEMPNESAVEFDAELDDGFDDDFTVGRRGGFVGSAIASPGALAISSLTLAILSLFGPITGTALMNALAASHERSPLFGPRAESVTELVLSAIAGVLALLALSSSHPDDEQAHRGSRGAAGAAIVLAVLSAAIAITALIILGTVPDPANNPFG